MWSKNKRYFLNKSFLKFSRTDMLVIDFNQLQCGPRKGFGSADCLQRDREMVYIVSQSADPNFFRGSIQKKGSE